MNNIYFIILSLSVGLIIGTLFFCGLWWTVKKAMNSKNPAIWFIGSIIMRFGVTLMGFYFVSNHHWERMVICLAGFFISRVIIIRFTRITELKKIQHTDNYENQYR